MPNYAEYFEKNRYKAKYDIGDRVFGYYNKIPFVGTVGNDTLISEIEGPRISIFVDLPIKVDKEYRSIIIVKHKDIKRLKSMDDKEPLKLPVAGSIPSKRTNQNGKEKTSKKV